MRRTYDDLTTRERWAVVATILLGVVVLSAAAVAGAALM